MELMCRAERARDTWRGTTLTLAFARDAQVLDRLKSSALRRSEDESCEVLFKATTQEEGAATRACQMGGPIGRHAESRPGQGRLLRTRRSPYVPMPPKRRRLDAVVKSNRNNKRVDICASTPKRTRLYSLSDTDTN